MSIRSSIHLAFSRLASAASLAVRGPKDCTIPWKKGMIDALEPRRLLSTPIFGSPGDDTFVISVQSDNRIFLLYNGVSEVLPAPVGSNLVEVFDFAGNDDVWILETNTLQFNIYDTAGNDTYRFGIGHAETQIERDITVFDTNGAGDTADKLFVEDSVGDGNGTTWMTDGTRFTILSSINTPSVVFNLGAEDSVSLNGGAGSDIVYFEGVRPNFNFNMGPGDDVLDLGGGSHRVDYLFPAGVSINLDGGAGSDTLVVDDSNTASSKSSMRIDRDALLGAIDTTNWETMYIATHNLPGDVAETVQFTGVAAPAASIVVLGAPGADLVQFGTVSTSIRYGSGYFGDTVYLNLAGGSNRANIFDGDSPDARTWQFNGTTMTVNGLWDLFSSGSVEMHVNGTNAADNFIVNSVPANWSLYLNGRGGDDVFSNGTADIDNTVGNNVVRINGGNGSDSVFLNDSGDVTGDVDGYTINGVGLSKGDFGIPQSLYVVYEEIERLNVTCDNDGSVIRFTSLSGLPLVEIDGGGGNDTFTNVIEGSGGTNLENNLADTTVLNGGSGSDTLAIDDHFGSTGAYDMNSVDFAYIRGVTHHVQFTSFSSITVDGSDQGNNIYVRAVPIGASLFINGAGGNDNFVVGGGDIDSLGFGTTNATMGGGTGTDSILFDDIADDFSLAEVETYNWDTLTIAKGASGITYTGFDSQALNIADVNSAGGVHNSTVNLNSTSGSINSTIFYGGAARGSTVNVGAGFVSNIAGTVTTYGGAGGMTVSYNDQSSSGDKQYQTTTTQVFRNTVSPVTLNYNNVTKVIVNAGTGNDQILVEGIAAGTTIDAHGNNGNDLIVFGNFGSYFATLLGNGNAFGDAGTDQVLWSTFDSQPITATLTDTALALTVLGRSYGYSTVESRWVNFFNTSALNLGIQSVQMPTTVTGGAGSDTILFGTGGLIGMTASATVNGQGGNDTLTLDDHNFALDGTYQFAGGELFQLNGFSIDANDIEHTSLTTGSGHDAVTVNGTSPDLSIATGAGNDVVSVKGSVGLVTVDTGSEMVDPFGFHNFDVINVNIDSFESGDVAGSVRVAKNDLVGSASVSAFGTSIGLLKIEAGATLTVANFLTFTGGTIDLAGGSLLKRAAVTAPTLSQLRTAITNGRSGGSWNGAGSGGVAAINSSLASGSALRDGVGYGLGSQIGIASIGGFAIAPGDTLLRYTLDGDLNLDATVNAVDLSIFGANWQGTNRVFTQGDFNYDGITDIADLYSLSSNWLQSYIPPLPAVPISASSPVLANLPRRTPVRTIELIKP